LLGVSGCDLFRFRLYYEKAWRWLKGGSMANPGSVALLGSGETTALGGQVFELVLPQAQTALRIGILETPAGFELNSAAVAGRVQKYLEKRLQNLLPRVELIPARARATAFSPDDPVIAARIAEQDLLFMGPGSPSYAVRQLRDSLAWNLLQARHAQGVPLILSSAAAIAAGKLALPVYEIYKVGEDPHWKPGLDLLGYLGLHLVIIPHWNNNDGGEELDTQRCFLGLGRWQALVDQVDPGLTVVGIDESTAAVIDFAAAVVRVIGQGSVHLIRAGEETAFARGETFPLDRLGTYRAARPALSPAVWEMAGAGRGSKAAQDPAPVPQQVTALVAERQKARAAGDWPAADRLRGQILALGWTVLDTPDGPQVVKVKSAGS
jgi:hypothetical protein